MNFRYELMRLLKEQIEESKNVVADGAMDPATYHRTCGGIYALRTVLDHYIPEIDKKVND
jgi:hypothetical protein